MRYVIIKYNTSDCNKKLLKHIKDNIAEINSQEKTKVVIVYKNLVHKLGKINTLPVLVSNGRVTTGVSDIISELSRKKVIKKENVTDLQSFWKDEMTAGDDNDDTNEMDKVKNSALSDMNRRAPGKVSSKPKSSYVSDPDECEVGKMESDPLMKKFWANQECTPGT